MAQTKSKPKVKKPVLAAARQTAAKATAGKPSIKSVARPATKSRPVEKAKAASPSPARAAPVAKAVSKSKPGKPTPKVQDKAARTPAATAKAAAKVVAQPPSKLVPAPSAPRRPVAVSHRPQKASALSVQSRPVVKPGAAASAAAAGASKPAAGGASSLTEALVRRAPESAYMNDEQLAFFSERLMQMRNEVLTREVDVKERLHQREVFADPADRASAEEEHWLDLRLRERESLLLKKIDDSLRRIRDKDYGFCEKTGEPIGIARLLARPTATVCVDIKGQDERAESQYRDR